MKAEAVASLPVCCGVHAAHNRDVCRRNDFVCSSYEVPFVSHNSYNIRRAGNPPLRLANGTNRCSGRVEILHNDQWGTVCDDDWDIRDAQVVCRAMDCGSAQMAKRSAYFGQGEGDIWLDDVKCVGNESSLLHCQHPNLGENNCGHGEDAGVVCSGISSQLSLC